MAKYVGENSLSELVAKTKALVNTKQNALPTTTTAGKVLKSTSTAGTVEWGEAGGSNVTITLNGSTTTTPSFYAPTSSISTNANKRYLLGSSSTTSVAKTNTNSTCFMQSGKLYSNSSEVLTQGGGLPYTTTAPTAANTDGVKIVVLSSEPATKYSGWLYIITSSYSPNLSVNDLLTYVYPVGSIYMSTSSTSPASFLGGTWAQLKDTFLLAHGDTYTSTASSATNQVSAEAGEATHTLTISEMPTHNHNIKLNTGGEATQSGVVQWQVNNWQSYPSTIQDAGGGQAHNNMPPYLVVYMWKRIA